MLLEAPWVNGNGKTDSIWPYPEVVEGYAIPLVGPGLGIAFDEALVTSKLLRPRCSRD